MYHMQLVSFVRLEGEYVPQNYSVKRSRIMTKNKTAISNNNSTRSRTCSSDRVEEKVNKGKYGTTVIANPKFFVTLRSLEF